MSLNQDFKQSDPEQSLLEKFGCLIFTIAALLLAAQRYLAFVFLGWESASGSSTAFSIMDFMFGDPPYSVFDVLLGFQIPDEGIFFLLQPHNLALGLVQAVHFGINVGLTMFPFWLLAKIRKLTRTWRLLGYAGCASVFLVPLALLLSVLARSSNEVRAPFAPSPSAPPVVSQNKLYSSQEYGIRFRYPAYLDVQSDSMRDRGPNGEIIQMISISATSTDPLVGIILRVVEDPLRNQMFPNLYPPDMNTLQILIVGELADFDYDDTPENKSAVLEASDLTLQSRIAGHHAGVYHVGLSDATFGHMYIRGALVITETRDISIFVIGSDEPGVAGSVSSTEIDSLWDSFVESIQIEY